MRICFVEAYYDPSITSGSAVIDRFYTLREFARGQAALGHDVRFVHLFHRDELIVRNGVSYHFLRPSLLLGLAGRVAGTVRHDWPHPYYQLGTRLLAAIRAFRPDVIHYFGLTIDLNLALVAAEAQRHGIPLVVHFHGGGPARSRLKRALQRRNLRTASRLLFTTQDHAQPWLAAGVLEDPSKVVEFMETSSPFEPLPREQAREQTSMAGQPVFLWAGRLHPVKDPLTALRGFDRIRRSWPDARLYIYPLTGELLPEVRQFLADRPDLSSRVELRERAPYDAMPAIYSSADFLLQASRSEFSGCAVLEAMSCGAIPVVSDIPSFRTMTDCGHYGVLFPVGDDETLARRVLSLQPEAIPHLSCAVRTRFQRDLSFASLSRQLEAIYRSAIDDSKGRTA